MKQAEIALLLPEIFRRTLQHPASNRNTNVLGALLAVMEQLHAPDEAILENLDCYFNPERVPAAKAAQFLPFLARWVDLDWLLPASGEYEAGLDCLRDLLLAAPRLASLRGTRQGLVQFLETATGIRGCRVEDHPDLPFYIIITCPHAAGRYRALIERIVAGEKPAYVKCELKFIRPGSPASRPGGWPAGGTPWRKR